MKPKAMTKTEALNLLKDPNFRQKVKDMIDEGDSLTLILFKLGLRSKVHSYRELYQSDEYQELRDYYKKTRTYSIYNRQIPLSNEQLKELGKNTRRGTLFACPYIKKSRGEIDGVEG